MKTIKDCLEFVNALETAVKQKDKKQILALYDANEVDWDVVNDSVADRYDVLVEEANLILGV